MSRNLSRGKVTVNSSKESCFVEKLNCNPLLGNIFLETINTMCAHAEVFMSFTGLKMSLIPPFHRIAYNCSTFVLVNEKAQSD